MNVRFFCCLATTFVLFACDQTSSPPSNKAKKPQNETKKQPVQKEETKLKKLPPPPTPLHARPSRLLAKKISTDISIGTMRSLKPDEKDKATPKKIYSIGMASCYDGWAFLPFVEGDEDNPVKIEQPIFLPYTEIPLGKEIVASVLSPFPNKIEVAQTFTKFSREHISATFTMRTKGSSGKDPKDLRWEAKIDGAPSALSSGVGLGHTGCFTTGYYAAKINGHQHNGPITARFEHPNFYRIHMMLHEKHAITILLRQNPESMTKETLLENEDLGLIFKNFKQYPVRVFFETKTASAMDDSAAETHVTWRQQAIQKGQIKLAFAKTKAEGPILVSLKNVELPAEKDSKLGEKVVIEELRAMVTPVTDPKGIRVPYVRPPKWW